MSFQTPPVGNVVNPDLSNNSDNDRNIASAVIGALKGDNDSSNLDNLCGDRTKEGTEEFFKENQRLFGDAPTSTDAFWASFQRDK